MTDISPGSPAGVSGRRCRTGTRRRTTGVPAFPAVRAEKRADDPATAAQPVWLVAGDQRGCSYGFSPREFTAHGHPEPDMCAADGAIGGAVRNS